jgi:hypothetical protein
VLHQTKTREAIETGLAMSFRTVDRPDLVQISREICRRLRLDWFVNIQFKGDRLLEVNPRVSTFVYQEDFNLPYLGIKYALGELDAARLGGQSSLRRGRGDGARRRRRDADGRESTAADELLIGGRRHELPDLLQGEVLQCLGGMVELTAAAVAVALVQLEDAAGRRRGVGRGGWTAAASLVADIRGEEVLVEGRLEGFEGVQVFLRRHHLGDQEGSLESRSHGVEEGEVVGLAGLPDDLEGARGAVMGVAAIGRAAARMAIRVVGETPRRRAVGGCYWATGARRPT